MLKYRQAQFTSDKNVKSTKDKYAEQAENNFDMLLKNELRESGFTVEYDEGNTIGKRYARADEIGIPLAVTVDFDTLEDNQVTVRDRDTEEQERIPISDLKEYLEKYYK